MRSTQEETNIAELALARAVHFSPSGHEPTTDKNLIEFDYGFDSVEGTRLVLLLMRIEKSEAKSRPYFLLSKSVSNIQCKMCHTILNNVSSVNGNNNKI